MDVEYVYYRYGVVNAVHNPECNSAVHPVSAKAHPPALSNCALLRLRIVSCWNWVDAFTVQFSWSAGQGKAARCTDVIIWWWLSYKDCSSPAPCTKFISADQVW